MSAPRSPFHNAAFAAFDTKTTASADLLRAAGLCRDAMGRARSLCPPGTEISKALEVWDGRLSEDLLEALRLTAAISITEATP